MFETKPLVHGLSWSADTRRMVLQILLAALLVFLISAVQAQTAPGDDNRTALGDAWEGVGTEVAAVGTPPLSNASPPLPAATHPWPGHRGLGRSSRGSHATPDGQDGPGAAGG